MGLDAPGTYIPSPAPSGFSDPMPPITVEANGNPSYGPSPTEDEDKEPTKVKRSPIPTKTHYVDSSKFKSLDSTVKNKKWQDKEGWAIQAGTSSFHYFSLNVCSYTNGPTHFQPNLPPVLCQSRTISWWLRAMFTSHQRIGRSATIAENSSRL